MKKRMMRVSIRPALAVCMAVLMAAVGGPPSRAADSDRVLTVMTRNMYLGTDLQLVIGAETTGQCAGEPAALLTRVAEAYATVRVSNIPERAAAVAEEIGATRPDLVGLQEVALWRTGEMFSGAPATDVSYDSLKSLLDELAARGLHYAPVATLTNFDAEVPACSPSLGIFLDVRYTQRDVVLARTDLKTSEFKVEGVQSSHFETLLVFPTQALGTVTVPRGWISVDAKLRGKPYRFVSTHLEAFHPGVRYAQAGELISGPGQTRKALVFAGDFNSDAESSDPLQNSTYQLLISAGFVDAWEQTHPTEPGYTSALHGNDPLVFTVPNERLDLVLWRGEAEALSAVIVGEDQTNDLTPSGLWPSDHAGVVASLNLKP